MKTRLSLLSASLAALVAIMITVWINVPPTRPPNITPVSLTAPAVSSPDIHAEQPQVIPPHIVLHGTFVNEEIQLALISMENENQQWLKPKDHINPDFYLDGIFKDHVVIRDAKNTMALKIQITTGGATQELLDIIPAMQAHAWVESLPPVPGIDRLEPNHYRIKRELIVKELQSGEIFKQVRILPEENGGFYIDRIRQGSMAEVIGLRVGDTIHKINDKSLTNITDVLDLYKNLDSLEKVDVEINRMQQVQNLHYELN